jgi:SecY interacting protein Syd
MKSTQRLNDAIWQLGQQYCQLFQENNSSLPQSDYDPDWPSPCIQRVNETTQQVYWQPQRQNPVLDFSNVEQALEITLHQDIVAYYTAMYSDVIYTQCEYGVCELLFAWSEDDFKRLQQNLIGHLLMKKRLKQPATLFFALTDEEDTILSVDNNTGCVMVEQVGLTPTKVIAQSLADFIEQLTPIMPVK